MRGNVTPTESSQTTFTKFTKTDLPMLHYNVHKPLFNPKISAILAHASSFSSSIASR